MDRSQPDHALTLGMTPKGDFVGGEMAKIVNNGTSKLPAPDLAAIVAYLKSSAAHQLSLPSCRTAGDRRAAAAYVHHWCPESRAGTLGRLFGLSALCMVVRRDRVAPASWTLVSGCSWTRS